MNNKRKSLVKIVGVGSIPLLASNSWIKPVVNTVILPAHAQTSTCPNQDFYEICGPSTVSFGTSPAYFSSDFEDNLAAGLTVTVDGGIISNTIFEVIGGVSITYQANLPETLALGNHLITFTFHRLFSDGVTPADDIVVSRTITIV